MHRRLCRVSAAAVAVLLALQGADTAKPADCDCRSLAQVPAVRPGDIAKNWTAWNTVLGSEVAAADNAGKAFDVVFYGDSITEQYRGTNVGTPVSRADGSPAVFARHFSQYATAILAAGGDMIGHLQWRLLHGGQTPKLAPSVAVMLIGTNDFGAVDMCFGDGTDDLQAATGVNNRLKAVVSYLRLQWPKTHVILVGILPRGGWTMPEDPSAWPNRFTEPIAIVNNASQALAALDAYVHYVDCGLPFYSAKGIDMTLMPDALHPTHDGMELLAQCYAPLISQLVAQPAASGPAYAWPAIDPTVSPCQQESAGDSTSSSTSRPLITAVRRAVSMGARTGLRPPDPSCPLC